MEVNVELLGLHKDMLVCIWGDERKIVVIAKYIRLSQADYNVMKERTRRRVRALHTRGI